MAHAGVDFVRSLFADGGFHRDTVLETRAAMDALIPADVPAPEGATSELCTVAGRPADRLTPDVRTGDGVILYLHGGGYCIGGLHSHRDIAGRLAIVTGTTVISLDYRRGPEDPFPAAVDDAVAAYRELAADGAAVALAGDSAGGGLSVAAAVALRDAGDRLPAALVCMSPWTDLTQSAASYEQNVAADPTVTKDGLDLLAEAYLAGHDARDPLASPRFADLTGLPPMRIDVGDAEVLLDDATGLADAALAAGVEVELQVWPELFHVFQVYPAGIVPETDESLAAIAAFLGRHLQHHRR